MVQPEVPGLLVEPSSSSETSSSEATTTRSLTGLPSVSRGDRLEKLLTNNRAWSEARKAEDPEYFDRLCSQQNPHYFWIGCADSRVPANVILGLEPGDVFVQRNVGNQATHTDLNCMSCLEYAVKEVKVKTIMLCGHYNCGAVKAALRLPSKTQNLVNCWISDIRECRNQHRHELRKFSDPTSQVDRLCELNVLRQTFHVCTSPVVQAAWDQGQELNIFGLIYSLKDGLIRKLVGPISGQADFRPDLCDFVEESELKELPEGATASEMLAHMENMESFANSQAMHSRVREHVSWSGDAGCCGDPALMRK